jgi:hypothetical protein
MINLIVRRLAPTRVFIHTLRPVTPAATPGLPVRANKKKPHPSERGSLTLNQHDCSMACRSSSLTYSGSAPGKQADRQCIAVRLHLVSPLGLTPLSALCFEGMVPHRNVLAIVEVSSQPGPSCPQNQGDKTSRL